MSKKHYCFINVVIVGERVLFQRQVQKQQQNAESNYK